MAATTAIITGSGRGIGRETAMMLAKKGVNVVVCSRTQREINETVDEIRKFNARVIGVKCDVGAASDVDMLVKKTVKEFGGIDILINNAAVLFVKRLSDTTEKEWDQTINSNLKSTLVASWPALM